MTATTSMNPQHSTVGALAQALGITDPGPARVLNAFGFDQTCATLRARVIGPCTEPAEVSGGPLGLGSVSDAERDWLLTLADDLRMPDEVRQAAGGGVS
jgi:hypothetical protein